MNLRKEFLEENEISKTRVNARIKDYKYDRQGNIIIKANRFIISRTPVTSYNFTNGWILLSQPGVLNREGIQGRMALVKTHVADRFPNYYQGTDAEITMANNFILTELARQFALESAEYYNVSFEDCDELHVDDNYKNLGNKRVQKIEPRKRYLLSMSFKEKDEELIHYADILSNRYELRAEIMLEQIVKYLEIRKISQEDIEKVKKDFIKQCIFNKFIDYSDEHNLNGGVLVKNTPSERRARLAPCFDLDFSAGVYNMTNGDFMPTAFFRKSNNLKFDLNAMLEQFKGEFEKTYLEEVLTNINLDEAIKKGEEYGNFNLSEKAKRKYKRFFESQMKDLRDFFEKNYNEKNIVER